MAKTNNVLVIGDQHCPFEHPDYLAFCKSVQKRFKTTKTVFIGDEIDNHAASRHLSDANGHGAGHELALAKKQLSRWYKAFPNATVIIGNHTAIPRRQLAANGVPQEWCRTFNEVLEVPKWNYVLNTTIDGVFYVHGEGVTARTRALRAGQSVVQGHRHTEGYVWYLPNGNKHIFGMQVGSGIDHQAYAFAYAKDHPNPILSCGVVLGGTEAHVIPMPS